MEKRTLNPLRVAFIILVILSVIGNLVVPDILSVLNLDNGLDRDYGWEFEKVLTGFLNGLLSFFLVGFFSIRNPKWFEALPQSISFGVLAASFLLGVIVRSFRDREQRV